MEPPGASGHDATQSSAAAAIAGSSDLDQLLWTATAVGVMGLDERGRVRRANPAAERLFAHAPGALVGRAAGELLPDLPPGLLGARAEQDEPPLRAPAWLVERERAGATRADDRPLVTEMSIARLPADGALRYLVLLNEATRQLRDREHLEQLAYHDTVTALPNRAYLMARLEAALGQAREDGRWPALLFIDFDRFKAVNDSLGHEQGDRVLRILGRRLAGAVRPTDTVARHGGDEFVVLMEHAASPEAAERIAGRVLAALHEPVRAGERHFPVSVSIGIALGPAAGTSAESLLRAADAAMYRVKGAGGAAFAHARPA